MSEQGWYGICQACGAIVELSLMSGPCACGSQVWAYVSTIEDARLMRRAALAAEGKSE